LAENGHVTFFSQLEQLNFSESKLYWIFSMGFGPDLISQNLIVKRF